MTVSAAVVYLYVVGCSASSHCKARERFAFEDMKTCWASVSNAKQMGPSHTTENEDTTFIICAGANAELQWGKNGDEWRRTKVEQGK